jgi:ABC-type uncharacterized transport system YnjBCD substrate-binding protein
MALGRPLDLTNEYKRNIYNIVLDMSGWDKTAIQVIGPLAAAIYVYGTNDANALQGVRDGNAQLAINFNAIQASNLATGTAANSMATAGAYKVEVNERFLKLAGGGADVYRLLAFHSKVS